MSKQTFLDVLENVDERDSTGAMDRLHGFVRLGLEPTEPSDRRRCRLVGIGAFVERNYNFVELGPRGTG